MPAYDWQQEEEDLLLYQSQENKDSDIEHKTDNDKYHDPTKPPEENMENIPQKGNIMLPNLFRRDIDKDAIAEMLKISPEKQRELTDKVVRIRKRLSDK